MVFCIDQVPQALQTRYGASGIRQAPVPDIIPGLPLRRGWLENVFPRRCFITFCVLGELSNA